MSDYIRRQDLINALSRLMTGQTMSGYTWMYTTDVHDAIASLPSADVAPVVRCKDCKHYYFADNRIPQEQRYVCKISGEIWKPDSFCSYGERREE